MPEHICCRIQWRGNPRSEGGCVRGRGGASRVQRRFQFLQAPLALTQQQAL